MNLVFEKIEQVLIAGNSLDIGIAGSFLRLSECAWPVTVVLEKGGRIIGSMGKMLAGDYVEGVDFDAVTIINGPVGQSIGVQISGGGAGSNRVLGEVSVIDGNYLKTIAGKAFMGVVGVGALAANYSNTQIFNPVGNTKRLVISQVSATSTVAGALFQLRSLGSGLSTLNGVGVSKNIGGGASLAELRSVQAASLSGSLLGQWNMVANTPFIYKCVEPVVLEPGKGLILANAALNADISATFEWSEEV